MFRINIRYIVLSLGLNPENNQIEYYIFSKDKDSIELPSIELEKNQSILEARTNCFKNDLGLDLSWIDDQLLDINNEKDNINIYYMCRLPIETKINNGQFISISSNVLIDPMVQKAIRYA